MHNPPNVVKLRAKLDYRFYLGLGKTAHSRSEAWLQTSSGYQNHTFLFKACLLLFCNIGSRTMSATMLAMSLLAVLPKPIGSQTMSATMLAMSLLAVLPNPNNLYINYYKRKI
jgi:hypothetical protein